MANAIETVAVLGSGGTVGSLSGGLLAQNGLRVYFLSRTQERAQQGLQRAIAQARSEVIADNITCGDYDSLLEGYMSENRCCAHKLLEFDKLGEFYKNPFRLENLCCLLNISCIMD